jgi:hypothetical protein
MPDEPDPERLLASPDDEPDEAPEPAPLPPRSQP